MALAQAIDLILNTKNTFEYKYIYTSLNSLESLLYFSKYIKLFIAHIYSKPIVSCYVTGV